MKRWIRREIDGPRFSRHPNTKRRERSPAIDYSKHTIRAALARHKRRLAAIDAAKAAP